MTQLKPKIAGDARSASAQRLDPAQWIALLTVLAGALAMRLALVPLLRNRPTHDLRIFVSWAQLLARYGSHGLYQHVDTIDHYPVNYPPLFGVVLEVVNAVYRRLVSHGDNTVLLGMLLKIPAIVSDIVLCVLVFAVVRRWLGVRSALWATALAAFAPSTWPISALWGQVDSICTAFMLLALTLVFWRRYTLAWIALALAVLVKPLPVVVIPLLLVAQLKDQRWSPRFLLGPACAMIVAYVVALPFAPTAAPLGVFHWLALEYASGQSLSDATSVNAYNLWTLAWPVTSDTGAILGVTLHTWGWLAFSAVLALTTWKLLNRLAEEPLRIVQEQLMTRAWFIVLAALFLLLTRMHERYILFALALAPLMWFCGRWERRSAAALIVTFTISVTLILGFYEHSWLREMPVVTHLLSLVNLCAFAAAAIPFLTERSARPVLSPAAQSG